MSEVTGTDSMPPATPFVVAPARSMPAAEPTGSDSARAPATPLVVPPLHVQHLDAAIRVRRSPERITRSGALLAGVGWLISRRNRHSGIWR